MTDHTCKAVEHCHVLNERLADFDATVARLERDANLWHNALARESRAQAAVLATHREELDYTSRRVESLELATAEMSTTAPDCGGCAGQGAHRRWCPEVVGEKAARLGRWAEEADSLGDRIGANDPEAANRCYNVASRLSGMARASDPTSGRWSRACDEQSVGDSHRSPARSAQLALTYITHALISIEDREDPALHIARAGAYVRAWRKSLPEQGLAEFQRPPTTTARGTLLQSGHWVLSAVASSHPDIWLAETEAALRLAWKQATR